MDSEHPTPTPQSPAPVPAFARAAGRAWRTVGYIGSMGWLTQLRVCTFEGVLNALPSKRS